MSPAEGFINPKIEIKDLGPSTPLRAEKNVLLAEPPYGSLDEEWVRTASEADLLKQLAVSTKRIVGEELPAAELIGKEGFPKSKPGPQSWDYKKVLQMLVLYLDGRSNFELATFFTADREGDQLVTENLVASIIRRQFHEKTKRLGTEAMYARKWHKFLHSENPETAKQLSDIQIACGGLPLGRIFISPYSAAPKNIGFRRAQNVEDTMYTPEIAIELVHYRLCKNGKTSEGTRKFASQRLDKEISQQALAGFFLKILTPEVRLMHNIGNEAKGVRSWETEDLQELANAILSNPERSGREIAEALGRTHNTITKIIRVKGELLSKRPEYENMTPIEAFLHEYGDTRNIKDKKTFIHQVIRTYRDTGQKAKRAKLAA